jgi:hypothetical protein
LKSQERSQLWYSLNWLFWDSETNDLFF